MSLLAFLAALVLGMVLSVRRRPDPAASTPADLVAAVRALGWRTATLRGITTTAAVTALVLGCLLVAALGITLKALDALFVLLGGLSWHLADLIDWKPVRLVEFR